MQRKAGSGMVCMMDNLTGSCYTLALATLTVPAFFMLYTYLKLLLMALFWGGTFIAGRRLALEVGPFCGAFLRFLVASIFLVAITLRTEKRLHLPKRSHLIPLVLMGLTGIFLYNVFFLKGLKLIEAGRASIIIASNPIFIAIMSALIFRDRLNRLKAAGILISISGAVTVITRGEFVAGLSGGFGWGELFIYRKPATFDALKKAPCMTL